MTCPLCKTGTLKKKIGVMIYCDGYQPQKEGNDWFNAGTCDFHVAFNQQKTLGRVLDDNEIRSLIEGKPLRNKKGDTLELDLTNTKFFTKMTYAEDKDF